MTKYELKELIADVLEGDKELIDEEFYLVVGDSKETGKLDAKMYAEKFVSTRQVAAKDFKGNFGVYRAGLFIDQNGEIDYDAIDDVVGLWIFD